MAGWSQFLKGAMGGWSEGLRVEGPRVMRNVLQTDRVERVRTGMEK